MAILSFRVILPITMHKCVVIHQCYFYKKWVATFIKKRVVIYKKNIIIYSKANKYLQNYKQTILP